MKQLNWKKIVKQALWVLLGVGTFILLGAAMQKKEHKLCSDIKIEITGAEKEMFIDEKDVAELLNSAGVVTSKSIGSIDLRHLENALEKNAWVKNAEMFFDNQQVLHVNIEEREPVARVFTVEGNSFYLDSSAMRLPLSDKVSVRVPMFTNFPSSKDVLSAPDSALLKDVVKIGRCIETDSFWMAQTAQIDIARNGTFEMVPTIGNELVVLGNADDIDKKLKRLYAFYKQAWVQHGLSTYEKLDVEFNGQVVAVRKGASKLNMDSVHYVSDSMMQQQAIMDRVIVKDTLKPTIKQLPLAGKNLVGSKQNKKINKSLSNNKKPGIAKKTIPSMKTNQPKAVMRKAQ